MEKKCGSRPVPCRAWRQHNQIAKDKGRRYWTVIDPFESSVGIVESTQILAMAPSTQVDFVPFGVACGKYGSRKTSIVKHGLSHCSDTEVHDTVSISPCYIGTSSCRVAQSTIDSYACIRGGVVDDKRL